MKKVIIALVTIVSVASLATVGTFAHFSDTEESKDNYLETGSIDLQLGDTKTFPPAGPPYSVPDEDYGDDPMGDSVIETWHYLPGYPGGMEPGVGHTLASMVKLQNVGDNEATSLVITCSNYNWAPDPVVGPFDKDTKMIIDVLVYHNNFSFDLLSLLKTKTGKDPVTLDDWENLMDPLIIYNPPVIGGEAFLEMVVRFGDAGDEYQECRTYMTLIFTLK